MRKDLLLAIATVLTCCGLVTAEGVPTIAVSNNLALSEYNVARIDALEAELAELRAMTGSKGKGGYDKCCYDRGVYANIDLALLKPNIGALAGSVGGGAPLQLTPSHDYEASPRLTLGYINETGLGMRARYWTFNSNATVNVLGGNVSTGVDAQSLDLDVTQLVTVCGVQMNLFGGVKYGKVGDGVVIPIGGGVLVSEEFEGIGPTLGMDFRRAGNRNLALVGGLRGAWLYGETGLAAAPLITVSVDDQLTQVWEGYIGIEYSRDIRNATFVARAVWEAQAWEIAPVASLIGQDIGFQGPMFSLGLQY